MKKNLRNFYKTLNNFYCDKNFPFMGEIKGSKMNLKDLNYNTKKPQTNKNKN